jgi:hypothetical protein
MNLTNCYFYCAESATLALYELKHFYLPGLVFYTITDKVIKLYAYFPLLSFNLTVMKECTYFYTATFANAMMHYVRNTKAFMELLTAEDIFLQNECT